MHKFFLPYTQMQVVGSTVANYVSEFEPCQVLVQIPVTTPHLKMSTPVDVPPTTEEIPPHTTDNVNPFASNGTSDRAITGGPEWWRRSFAYMTNMGMSLEERTQFEADRGLKREQEQCVRCEKWRDYNLRYSSSPRYPPQIQPTDTSHTHRPNRPIPNREY